MGQANFVRVRAYTSVANLGYGFDVFAVAVDAAYDVVEASHGHSGISIVMDGPYGGGLSSDPMSNTAGRAAAAVCEAAGIPPALRLRIWKGTRPGSGLGSSAASAAASAAAVDELLGLRLPRERLVRLGAEGEKAAAGTAHTDNVAAAAYGGFVIYSNETPPQVLCIRPPAELRFVVARPSVQVTTREARGVLPADVPLAEFARSCARAGIVGAAMATGDLAALGRAIEGSDIESRRGRLIPGYARVCEAARKAGALGVTISGSGPTIAAAARASDDTQGIAAAMREAFGAVDLTCDTFVAGVAPGAAVVEAFA